MHVNRWGRWTLVLVAAAAALAPWLITRPDRAGAQWTDGSALQYWLVAEAVVAVVVGLLSADRKTVVWSVSLGWALQMLHFALLGDHYDGTLWAVGLFMQGLLGGVALGLGVLSQSVAHRRPARHA